MHSNEMRLVTAKRHIQAVVLDYNTHMGGANHADKTEYSIEKKRKYVSRKIIIFHFLNQLILYSYVVHLQVAT